MGGMYYREFTRSFIFRDFKYILKDPPRYVYLFLLLTLLSTKKIKNRHTASFSPNSLAYQKHLKLGQCLEMYNRRSLGKFVDVT